MQPLTCPRCGAGFPASSQGPVLTCAYCSTQVRAPVAPQIPPLDWKVSVTHPDGRLFVSDTAVLMDVRYVPCPALPQRTVTVEVLLNILQMPTVHTFGFADLRLIGATGHYSAPGGAVLGRSYVDYLMAAIPVHPRLVLRSAGPLNAVLIEDGGIKIGALMPRRS